MAEGRELMMRLAREAGFGNVTRVPARRATRVDPMIALRAE